MDTSPKDNREKKGNRREKGKKEKKKGKSIFAAVSIGTAKIKDRMSIG